MRQRQIADSLLADDRSVKRIYRRDWGLTSDSIIVPGNRVYQHVSIGAGSIADGVIIKPGGSDEASEEIRIDHRHGWAGEIRAPFTIVPAIKLHATPHAIYKQPLAVELRQFIPCGGGGPRVDDRVSDSRSWTVGTSTETGIISRWARGRREILLSFDVTAVNAGSVVWALYGLMFSDDSTVAHEDLINGATGTLSAVGTASYLYSGLHDAYRLTYKSTATVNLTLDVKLVLRDIA